MAVLFLIIVTFVKMTVTCTDLALRQKKFHVGQCNFAGGASISFPFLINA